MSLLMQALRKAENAKQGGEVPAEPTSLSNETPPEFNAAAGRRTALSLEDLALSPMAPRQPVEEPDVPAAMIDPAAETHAEPAQEAPDRTLAQEAAPAAQFAPSHPSSDTHGVPPDTHDAPIRERDQVDVAATAPEEGSQATRPFETPLSDAELARARTMQARQTAAARKQADAVFAAKKPRPTPSYRLGAFAVLLLAVLGGGGYLAWMLMAAPPNLYPAMPPTAQAQVPPEQPAAVQPDPSAPLVTGEPPSDAPTGITILPPGGSDAPPASAGVLTTAAPAGRATPEPATSAPVAPAAAPMPERAPPRAAPLEPSQPAIEVHRAPPPARVDPVLSGAYKALAQGDLGGAQVQYQKVLQQDPNNRDALLGLATIASARNQAASAAAYYDRLLEIDPADPDAVAAMAMRDGDSVRSESRLKRALAERPDAGVLHFALGNVYARQARWSEAQRSYFRAYSSAPDNGNYIFNLAVSLDKLEQARLAIEFYRKALDTGSRDIDRAAIEVRIADLQGAVERGAR